jgi:hypothetical protein
MKRIIFGISLMTILFIGCDDDDDDDLTTETTVLGSSLSGDIEGDYELSSDTTYTLTGTLSIKDGGSLTIPAGTTIEAESGFSNYIIVEQGGQIYINGTSDAPVIMTSAEDSPAAGDWGGLVINGYAPIAGGGTGSCEMDATVTYGGDDDADNSGSITYLQLLYTGAQSSESVEHNGLTLDAVGSGTTIENLYIAYSADDAIEFFGGSVNVTNILSVSCDDDMFDFTEGYTGTITNAYGIWESDYTSGESDPRGVEADGNLDGDYSDYSGQSDFNITNLSIYNYSSQEMTDGLKIRRGATATITNAYFVGGTTSDIIDLHDSKGNAETETSISLTVSKSYCTSDSINDDGDTYSNVEIVSGNTGCDDSNFDWTGYDFDSEVTESISGDISDETILNALVSYTLDGTYSVKDGGSLIIPAGTIIEAESGFSNYIMVEQGGQIYVNGTSDEPVIMTSAEDSPAAGDWGGLVINGYASIAGGGTGSCEMDATVTYGGSDDSDNSGSITYLVLLYTGAQSSESVEHNGLTLDAVGSGTTIENLCIAYSADDAIEFFGGSVNVTNILSVSCDDDMFDFTEGYTGTLTNIYGIWESDFVSGESDPRGIEADGNLDGDYPDYSGQSIFTINDVTIVNNSSQEMTDAMKIRRGATATITNALIKNGSTADVIDLHDSKGNATTDTGISATVDSMTYSGELVNDDDTTYSSVDATVTGNTGADTDVFVWTGYSF